MCRGGNGDVRMEKCYREVNVGRGYYWFGKSIHVQVPSVDLFHEVQNILLNCANIKILHERNKEE